jgi:hypothetical protein
MGMRFNKESVAEDLDNIKYMFRDAAPSSEARAEFQERQKAKGEKEKEKEGEGKDGKRHMEAWPTEIMWLSRASELLQGCCSLLEVRHPFMHTMAAAARLGLTDRVPEAARLRPEEPLASPIQPRPGQQLSPLELKLRRIVRDLYAKDAFLGLQICVLGPSGSSASVGPSDGSPHILAEVAAGVMGHLDPRPVTASTPFPVLGASRLAVAATVQALVAGGAAALGHRVEAYWPAFGAAGKAACTLSELLRCRSGVEGTLCLHCWLV